jgi:hypothetical protein
MLCLKALKLWPILPRNRAAALKAAEPEKSIRVLAALLAQVDLQQRCRLLAKAADPQSLREVGLRVAGPNRHEWGGGVFRVKN